MQVQIILTPHGKRFYTELKHLQPETEGSAGIDLKVCLISSGVNKHTGRSHAVLHTGMCMWIKDPNYVGIIAPRSSSGLLLTNTIGVIDSDYQGEILLNTHTRDYDLGQRVAQLIIIPRLSVEPQLVDSFDYCTQRATNGFGSTGK
jgi:dUTP pyrophosphatase